MTSPAFEAHAPTYDSVAESALGRALRARVHETLAPLVGASDSVIDVGCGTGIDLQWLADRAATVVGVDSSPAMVERAAARCRRHANVTVRVGSATDLPSADADLLLANFGAINCMGPLTAVHTAVAKAVRSGGHLVAVTMPRFCPWERAVAVARLDRTLWARRTSEHRDRAYPGLTLTYATPRELGSALVDFEIVHTESLGLLLPPFEQRALVEARSRLLRGLDRAERLVARIGGRLGWGDHCIVVLQRRR